MTSPAPATVSIDPANLDPVALAQALIRRPSVTPADAGAMDTLQRQLEALGFACRRMKFGEIENLYARRGTARPNLCFAGHTDVVPVGDDAAWTAGPFEAEIKDGILYGRGAVDMKSAIAAFVAAVAKIPAHPGSISFLITGDEEGVAEDGTVKVVEALAAEGEIIDHCIVGEPTSANLLGDMVKIGRRGSINAWIAVDGKQGHVAYPHRAANPIPVLVDILSRLQSRVLDEGYAGFQPSNLEVTTIDVGNAATNVIPSSAKARLNIRFNPAHKGKDLAAWIEAECRAAAEGFSGRVEVLSKISGEAFLTEPGAFTDVIVAAVTDATGRAPELSTTGGTSDARFIRALCPVVEFGLVGSTMHQVDERVPVEEIRQLAVAYEALINRYFAAFA
ncbi:MULTISPECIES: succinyl-diaminopimelate desuccinylase [Caulobacter]|jgi:succinyl-diaminopimelate desuccinylase|uniref:Succinyl-diaminopimelate desuccinylase n=1 Tax=Caulobacter vibrioides OR37 TaxID=1292034 RepID=R0D407_CAUVI|nr:MULTISPECIES: succinyl-diaminopimelate desuccinylase [Caulobacter]ENZ83351.1 succinyldiaminopimelate desuccinylase [Caulobacter vibrioides OR37]MBQ1560751.1 succinyl-diaminopimelate desuccinylase [Caulobacter sp.]